MSIRSNIWGALALSLVLCAGCDKGKGDDKASGGGTKLDLAGSYAIASSSNPGGAPGYKGKVDIAKSGDAYALTWTIDGSPSYKGLGLFSGDLLGVGWGMAAEFGVVVYQVNGGRLTGSWATASAPTSIGTEVLDGPAGLDGEYKIEKGDGPGGSYGGTVEIHPVGDTYKVEWKLPNRSYSGTGIKDRDVLVVGWGAAEQGAGVVTYHIESGNLVGKWATRDGSKLGTEDLKRNAPPK